MPVTNRPRSEVVRLTGMRMDGVSTAVRRFAYSNRGPAGFIWTVSEGDRRASSRTGLSRSSAGLTPDANWLPSEVAIRTHTKARSRFESRRVLPIAMGYFQDTGMIKEHSCSRGRSSSTHFNETVIASLDCLSYKR